MYLSQLYLYPECGTHGTANLLQVDMKEPLNSRYELSRQKAMRRPMMEDGGVGFGERGGSALKEMVDVLVRRMSQEM